MFSPPLKKSIVFLKYALKMDLVKGAWFDLYDIENRILGSMEYFYDGLDSSGRPQYTVKASMTSNPLKLKSSKLVTRAEGVNSWHTNEEDHNGYTGTNSRSYVYTTPNPPSNPYCEAILTATDEKGDEYAVWKGTLRDAK